MSETPSDDASSPNELSGGATLTVAELCRAVQRTIDDAFSDELWVVGAISGLTRSANGHVYFDLVDPAEGLGSTNGAVVPVALFSSNRHRVNAILRRTGNIRMRDGVEIKIRGRVAYYPPQGRIQLLMSLIDPTYTLGQMAIARQALLDALAAEGLLDANRARPLPAVPLRVGLVTSAGSAAHADFVDELATSGFSFAVTLFDSRVQGLDAVPTLVDGIRAADRAGLDVVVVVRGGGARTDLAAFDHERVARAIAGCVTPVVVGVGHETDRSVADDVANTSAKTPTAAAGVLIERAFRFDEAVERAAERLRAVAARHVERATEGLAATARRLGIATDTSLRAERATLDGHRHRLATSPDRALDRAEAALTTASERLGVLDPARALARGWTITRTTDGGLVRQPGDVAVGTSIVTTTAGGPVISTVGGFRPEPGDTGADG